MFSESTLHRQGLCIQNNPLSDLGGTGKAFGSGSSQLAEVASKKAETQQSPGHKG